MDLASQAKEGLPRASAGVQLWLRLVGPFEARTADGTSALPVSKKARALLCLLALHRPQALRRDFAAGLLWSAKPREHAANSFRQALRELQIALAGAGASQILLTGGGRLALQNDKVWVDIMDPEVLTSRQNRDEALGSVPLCQDLRGLDPAFDAHVERLWKDVIFQQAFDRVLPEVSRDEGELSVTPLIEPAQVDTSAGLVDVDAGHLEEGVHGKGWRIAVIPFRNLGSTLSGGLALGMAEEISAALSRFRMPRVIATSSFWDGQGPSPDCLAKCRAFNLDYAISGTIQASGNRLRVTVSLVDVAMDFEVIWASRFDGTTDDLFTLQDTIASQTVAQIDPELLQRHHLRGQSVQMPKAAAHQSVLTAIQAIYRPDRERFLQAREMLEQAIELDQSYAAAHAWLAYWYLMGMSHGWIDRPAEAVRQAGIAAERSILLDPLDARGLTIAGHVKAYILHDVETALVLHNRATTLNPNLPVAWTLSSWAHIYNGDHRTAMKHAVMAESLSPNDPHVFVVEHAAMTAQFFLRNLVEADAIATSSLERRPRHATALRVRLAVLGHMGRTAEAREVLQALRSLEAETTLESIAARPPLRESDRDYYVEGLRRAGLES